MRGVSRPDLVGPIDKDELGLLEVPVDTFAGFVFLNPDPGAPPLADYLGPEVLELMAPYHLDQMSTVLNVRESIDCNWKVVMDAFQEGYHIQGIHPELLRVIVIDPTTTRYRFWDDHEVAVAPFEVANADPGGGARRDQGASRPRSPASRDTCLGSRSSSPRTATTTDGWSTRRASPAAHSCSRPPARR